ncbi:hypothetical protein RFI_38153 [Reticulomyxa filosa]|uniref:Mannosyltransferase n=1 Tax=Reticulomyxa filosa TaxID=46433 RepID=X6LBD5_RETFI|nr:hypothetical protein RFI_38153 [Reticulomyxa filosa]|eukprot:ETN99327.1 hypothetical protein RFI_38153 [Reticulomyxa filosa]
MLSRLNSNFWLDFLLLTIGIIYVWVCPFTKVEESFNMQASHDLLFHFRDWSQFDHHAFPGLDLKSGLRGSKSISKVQKPTKQGFFVVVLLGAIIEHKVVMQYMVRMNLMMVNLLTMCLFRNAWIRILCTQSISHQELSWTAPLANEAETTTPLDPQISPKTKHHKKHLRHREHAASGSNTGNAGKRKESDFALDSVYQCLVSTRSGENASDTCQIQQKQCLLNLLACYLKSQKQGRGNDDHVKRGEWMEKYWFRYALVFNILLVAQMHYLYYISRLLPNCLALPLATLAWKFYLEQRFTCAITALAISTIIFRCDTIVLAVPMIAFILIKRKS